jgi:cysteine desulfurase
VSAPRPGIYLDYNASTPIDPRVAGVMRGLLDGPFANPSATHDGGREAKAILDQARGQVAALLGAAPDEVVFTSGGSEANNAALKGVFFARRDRGSHIVTTSVEHPAVREPLRFLERLGARVTVVPVDGTGRVDPDDVRRAITSETVLVSVMHANNEVGTIEPVAEIAAIAREHGVSCTRMRPSRPARSPPGWTTWAWTCSRSRGTRRTRPRASARSTCAAASRWSR